MLCDELTATQEDRAPAGSQLLHEIFEAQADAHPQRIALWCEGHTTTYAELERKANQLAACLRDRGIGPGKLVAMFLPRSSDVYLAILAILKTGAAYVPLDSEYPTDRIAYILDDCQANCLVSTSALAEKLPLKGPTDPEQIILLDRQWEAIARGPARRLTRAETAAVPTDLCYVIYTSGSTGRPKGVAVEHRSVCNLVEAERRIFDVGPEDRVYQGFSIAFDASVEEVWLALAAGATLVVGTQQMIRRGADLAGLLAEAKVTVLDCVPTLLAMFEADVPSVRLLILGGEVCPPELVRRWARPGRRVVNTYGPTETTVIATFAECHPDQPVTIGRPVPNYRVHILDEHLQPVPPGVAGELCISGIGLARGYLGQPDLTAERFVPNPFAQGPHSARLYRTGDRARWTPDGQIEFAGRIDGQVKLRGYRIELSEVEAVLMEHPEVRSAAVIVREGAARSQQLVGYMVPCNGTPLVEDEIKAWLRTRLPTFMVPALLEVLPALPTLPSGKTDRGRLPPPRPRKARRAPAARLPRTPLESRIAAAWEELFTPLPVGLDDDFFLSLGGHSLLAATMVSELRKDPELQDLAVADVYAFPTVRALAAELTARRQNGAAAAGLWEATPVADSQHSRESRRQESPPTACRGAHALCAAVQSVSLYVILGFAAMQWMAPYLGYCLLVERGWAIPSAALAALGLLPLAYPLMLAAAIAIKWTVIGRYKAGSYPLWGQYYFRWWFVNRILDAVPVDYMAGTPLLNVFYRLLGARIGRGVHFASDAASAFDLLEVGDGSSIGDEAGLLGATVEDGHLRLGPIHLGQRCFVGARSIIGPDTRMEDDARLDNLSLLGAGRSIPAGETWRGSPAGRCDSPLNGRASQQANATTTRATRYACGVLHALSVLALPLVYLTAIFPGLILINWLGQTYGGWWYLPAAPLAALSFVVLSGLEITAVKWLLLGRVRPGRYPLQGHFYLRKRFFDQLMNVSLDVLGPLYATVYLPPWYRLLGARLGKRAELSTACSASPDLLTIDDESFIADSVSLGVARVEHGTITLAPTRVGRRAFLGNSALVAAGATIGDDALVGVLSAPPAESPHVAPRTSWLGSPAIFLPRRQSSVHFPPETTFRPTRRLWLLRAFVEFFRVTLPGTCLVLLTSLLIGLTLLVQQRCSLTVAVLAFPLLYLACGIAAALVVVATKWLLVGRYRPAAKPLWSSFVWRTELVNAMHEFLAAPLLTDALRGTPFLCWFFRLLGVRIGRRVYLETTDMTEFDLVEIGDDAALNLECTIQTHLFEDRVMKMSRIEIGPRCSVGAGSVVLYDSCLEAGAALSDLSLVMKGETLPAGTRWEGVPAQRTAAS